jgi:hypothetical protein
MLKFEGAPYKTKVYLALHLISFLAFVLDMRRGLTNKLGFLGHKN